MAISVARMAAVTCDALTKVVVRLLPFHLTAAPAAKPDPFTVRVKAGPPGAELAGDSDASIGAKPPLPVNAIVEDELAPN